MADFIEQAWPLVEPRVPYVRGWHIEVMCEHLEAVTKGEISGLVMNIPPRYMKSLTTCVFWPAWEWLSHPETTYLTVSHTTDLAARDARLTRSLMNTTGMGVADLPEGSSASLMQKIGYQGILRLIGGEWRFEEDQNEKRRYNNDVGGRRIATAIGGGATGEGGNRVIVDDPHKLEEWDSEAKLREAADFVAGVMPTRLGARSAAVLVMQRLNKRDATAAALGELEDRPGWPDLTHVCLPEQFEPRHPFVCSEDRRTEPGELLWPELFDEKLVKGNESCGAQRYASNYQQRPSPAEGNIFKREDWKFYGPSSDRTKLPHTWERVLCSWDLTFGETDDPGASWVVGQVWGKDGHDAYLLEQIRARMSYSEQKEAVRALFESSPLDAYEQRGDVLVEEKAAGRPLIEDLREVIPGLKGINPGASKVTRALSVQTRQETGKVYLPRTEIPAPSGYSPTATDVLIDEAANFPAGATDQVDVLAQALQELFRFRGSEAISISTLPADEEPVATGVAGLLHKVGVKYVDEPPPPSFEYLRTGRWPDAE